MDGHQRPTAQRGALLRLALLFALTAGVFGMHTLGHEHADAAAHPAMAMVAQVDGPHAPAGINGLASDGSHRPPLTDPTDVCIAVLVAALAWALLRAALRAADGRSHSVATTTPAMAVRGPPLRSGMGLLLADLAVLRN